MLSNISISIILMFFIGLVKSSCRLPNGCELSRTNSSNVNALFFCSNLTAKFEMGFDKGQFNQCTPIIRGGFFFIKIYLKESKPTILDESFDLEGLYKTYWNNSRNGLFSFEIVLADLKGFDINSFNFDSKKKRIELVGRLKVYLYDLPLVFYSKGKLVESCDDYSNSISGRNLNLFQACSFPCSFRLRRIDFHRPICPLVFKNSYIEDLFIYEMIDTFYKSNFVRFLSLKNSSINSSISSVILHYEDNINLDRTLLNLDVFKSIRMFSSSGKIKKIEDDLFITTNFPRLTEVSFGLQFFPPLIRHHGINWIKNINKELSYNLSTNLTSSDISHMKTIKLTLNSYIDPIEIYANPDVNSYFPDDDFCLYKSFPFHQLVLFRFDEPKRLRNLTCTLSWLLRYHPKLLPKDYNTYNIRYSIKKCSSSFKKLISMCSKSNIYNPPSDYSVFDIKSAMIIWQFVSIISLPIICIIGCISNVLVLVVKFNKKNKKELKENQYAYMTLKSATNSIILFVEIFSLLNECQWRNGIYCSSVRKFISVQYFRIVFSEFLCNYLRFASNLFHIAFSVNRLSLIGKEQAKFTQFMAKLTIRNYTIFVFVSGLFVTFVKGFRLRANFHDIDSQYPFVYITENNKNGLYGLKMSISILNCVCDLINGLVFFIFCTVVDFQLLFALRRTIAEKMDKLENCLNKTNADSQKESLKDAVFRATILVVLNTLVNLFLKTPNTVVSLVDFVGFIVGSFNDFLTWDMALYRYHDKPSIMLFKFVLLNSRDAFEQFAKCLYMISIGCDLWFYYKFDKIFKEAFLNVFNSKSETK